MRRKQNLDFELEIFVKKARTTNEMNEINKQILG